MKFSSIFFCLNIIIIMSHMSCWMFLISEIWQPCVQLFMTLPVFDVALYWQSTRKREKSQPYDENVTWQSAIYTLRVADISTCCFILFYVGSFIKEKYGSMYQYASMWYDQIVPGQDLFLHSSSSSSSNSSYNNLNDDIINNNNVYLLISVVFFCNSVIGTLYRWPSDLPPFSSERSDLSPFHPISEMHYWKLS